MVDTTFAAAPECFVIRQFVERDGYITEFRIHFHNGGTTGQTEYFGPWPA